MKDKSMDDRNSSIENIVQLLSTKDKKLTQIQREE